MPLLLKSSDRLFALTGAGISAESGLATFRGKGGLWEDNRAVDLATPEAFARDPELVWRFYSMRRARASVYRELKNLRNRSRHGRLR